MEKLITFLEAIPVWLVLVLSGLALSAGGLLIARRLWGKNADRLRKALDDSAYLASQWSALGSSQSELVEKLDQRMRADRSAWAEKERSWQETLRARDKEVDKLTREIRRIQEADSTMSEREIQALQVQVQELQKRDARINTLEARLRQVNEKNAQQSEEHKRQTEVLLERIEMLQSETGGEAEPAIEENNRQLTDLLKNRCEELERLRDDFFAKEEALKTLREQNQELKRSVESLVEKWAAKKEGDGELDSVRKELATVRKDYEKKCAELEDLQRLTELAEGASSEDERVRNLEEELEKAWGELREMLRQSTELKEQMDGQSRDIEKLETELSQHHEFPGEETGQLEARLNETRQELASANRQILALLEEIEKRDSKLEQLEERISTSSSSRETQVQVLSQTIAELQTKATENESGLAAARAESERLQRELDDLRTLHRRQIEDRDARISLLKEHVPEEELSQLESDLEDDEWESGTGNRVFVETKTGRVADHHLPARPNLPSAIYFEANSAFIKHDSLETIEAIAKEAEATDGKITLVGFTDDEGNGEFNAKLSLRRAEAVREKLEQAGLDGSLLVVSGKGRDEEHASGEESWRARRVEITILPQTPAEQVN